MLSERETEGGAEAGGLRFIWGYIDQSGGGGGPGGGGGGGGPGGACGGAVIGSASVVEGDGSSSVGGCGSSASPSWSEV